MGTKHTHGPWMFDPSLKGDGSFGGSYIVSNNAKKTWPLAEVYREDNARLIAAAPELLEALQYALHVRGTTEDGPHVVAIIEAAIAKARGE